MYNFNGNVQEQKMKKKDTRQASPKLNNDDNNKKIK